MTEEGEKVLLRKPRAPKLQKIDLSKVRYTTPPNSHIPDSRMYSPSSTDSSEPNERATSPDSEYMANQHMSPNKNTPNTVTSIKYQNMPEVLNITQISSDPRINYLRMQNYNQPYEEISYESFDPDREPNYHFKTAKQLSDAASLLRKASLLKTIPTDPKQKEAYITLREYSQFKNLQNSTMLKPYKPLGPDPLLPRYPKHFEDKKLFYYGLSYNKYEERNDRTNDFTLNDLLTYPEENTYSYVTKTVPSKPIISTRNYKQICDQLQEKIYKDRNENNEKVHITTLVPELTDFEHRIPLKQIVIEMASFLKQELSDKIGVKLKAKFNPLPKWQKMKGAHTEIIVYEDEAAKKKKIEEDRIKEENDGTGDITPAHLAVLDALIRNGLALSLKAHFIDKLPDLSSLDQTLIYLNLSFNCFTQIPSEILTMTQLEALKLRNNPIRTVPDELCYLQNLKILSLSYCQIEDELPECIYALGNLRHLDVSYNSIKKLSRLIVNLRNLKHLNVEGNELECVPATMLQIKTLEKLNVKNNYMHPLLWNELNKRTVQSLSNMAKLQVYRLYYIDTDSIENKVSKSVESLLEDIDMCDKCGGPRYGNELKSIQPCIKAFGVKYLPFIFECCSQSCYNSFKKNNVN